MSDYKYKEGPVLWDGENKSPAERENWSSENDYKLSQSSIISERIIKRLKNKII